MDTDIIEILTRALISAGILYLVLVGQVRGSFGVFAVTIIMGIDVVAAMEAFKQSQEDRDVTYQDQ